MTAPAPPSTISVGITGHRPNKLPKDDIPRIEQQLREVMAAIDRTAHANSTGSASRIRLISGFAEGVDQMAVAASPPGWIVEGILPFPKEEYLKDFEQSAKGDGRDVRGELLSSLARASTVTELPTPQAGPRDQGYLAAGRAMLRQIELLIAVWDGQEAKSGGTGQMVKEATQAGIPVVWLSANADREPVLVERFANGAPVASSKPWTAALG